MSALHARVAALLLAAVLVHGAVTAAAGPVLLTPEKAPKGVTRYTLTVTTGEMAPDCGRTRPVFLINGIFQPTIEVAQGDTLEVCMGEGCPSRKGACKE